ncbi:hypothetical protein [Streptomyces sp. DSM 40750]|uniref:hypothetical protein n=1 Tax=Streptomyces sp. DSM 40750 TaxID=2801030 RepID=UPI00214BC271|nr:hypothetical protein [Streptomyces sp. DSM 40750]UUU27842.1 hypothetical protein JIX55_05260 [Streptomyces sp. DSM 40750]
MALVHAGWADWYLTTGPGQRAKTRAKRRATGFAQSRAFAAWCWGHRIALMATDTFAVEVLPVLATEGLGLILQPQLRGLVAAAAVVAEAGSLLMAAAPA